MRGISICFTILFFLISNPSNAQIEHEVDSILQLIKTSKSDSLKMQWYNRLRRVTYYSNTEESFKYTQKFLELAQKNKYLDETALAQFYMGNSYIAKTDYNSALTYYLKASTYYESVNDSTRMASVFNGIGAAYENSGKDSLSLNYFKKSQQLSELLGDKRRNALALNNIANIYTRRGDVKNSILFLEKSVDNLTKKDKQYLNPILVNLANSYLDDSQLEKAEKIYNSVLSDVTISEDAFTYLLAKKGMGNIALEKEDFKNAVAYLEESFIVATSENFFEQRFSIMKDLINAYSYNKDYKKGLDLFYEYQNVKDSIFTSEKDKNLNEALQKYEAVKKDKAISEQLLQIEKQDRLKNWLISGAVVFAISSLLIFVFYRKRLKYQKTISEQTKTLQQQKITELEQNNKLIAMNSMITGQETERMRIAKDLHDGLGGLLSSVKAHFTVIKNDTKPKTDTAIYKKTNALIDEACVEVRRISHNMMPHALNISGLEDALIDLGESLQQDGVITTIEIGKIPKLLDETKSVMIYRLAQEIVANIRKHAQAKHTLLQLLVHKNKISLTIEDDGKGFDFDIAKQKKGLGLENIMSRVKFLDGTINFDSQLEKGTTVTIEIPIV